MRIAVAGFLHESNTYLPSRTDRAAFQAQSLHFGDALLSEWRSAHHEMGGFLASADELGFEALPLLMAWATPAGPVATDVFEEITGRLCDDLQRTRPDGLLLALHGAMVAEHHLAADREVLARVRSVVGPDFPVAVTFDLHANLPVDMGDVCDLAVAYRTNPHIDQRDCGRFAARLLVRWVKGEIRPRLAVSKPPMLLNIMKQDTSCEPMAGFMARALALQSQPGALAVHLLPGFAYADVPHVGPGVIAMSDGDRALAQRLADTLADELWQARERFHVSLPSPSEAVTQALRAERTPVVLVDTGDNVGGGSAADGTVLLAELLRQRATGAVVCLCDPSAVSACQAAGVGGTLTLPVGGRVDRLHGDPVTVTGRVRVLHDGRYVEPAVRHGGKRINHMGTTALLEIEGENLLVLTSLRHPPFSLGALTCLGVRPEMARMLVVKAAIAYKAAYGPVAGTIIEVDTPGLTAVRPGRLVLTRARRPLWPLDE